MDNKVLDEAVAAAWMAITGRDALGPDFARDHECMTQGERDDMRAALLAGVKVLLGQARPAIMDVDSERVAIVDRHDDCPSHGFQNVWIVDAPSLGEGDGR